MPRALNTLVQIRQTLEGQALEGNYPEFQGGAGSRKLGRFIDDVQAFVAERMSQEDDLSDSSEEIAWELNKKIEKAIRSVLGR